MRDSAVLPLPDPTDFGLSRFPDSGVAVRVPRGGLTLYRLVRSQPASLNDFQARIFARLVTGDPELLRAGLSHLTKEAALEFRRDPTSKVARLELTHHKTIHVARTNRLAAGQHVTVWAPAAILVAAIVAYLGD